MRSNFANYSKNEKEIIEHSKILYISMSLLITNLMQREALSTTTS